MEALFVEKADINQAKIVPLDLGSLAPHGVRLKIELFSLTANNVSYAATGSTRLGYWDFFPAYQEAAEFGQVPCWGFAQVEQSNVDAVKVGQRFYGFYPMASHLDVEPVHINEKGFIDGAAHRDDKSVIYNSYASTEFDGAYDSDFEAIQALYRPLFATGWWAADFMANLAPVQIILSSASSKTALGTAFAARALMGSKVKLIGLTSASNMDFVAATGLYDHVLAYDGLDQLSPIGPSILVDFLGRSQLIHAVHAIFGDHLVASMKIGATDWGDIANFDKASAHTINGPKPAFFFAPQYAGQRLAEDKGLIGQLNQDLRQFYPVAQKLTEIEHVNGAGSILSAWRAATAGNISANKGLILRF